MQMQMQRKRHNPDREIHQSKSGGGSGYSFFNLLCCSSSSFNEMLASSDSHDEEEDDQQPTAAAAQILGGGGGGEQGGGGGAAAVTVTQLLMEAGEAVGEGDWDRAGRLVAALSTRACGRGDATERLACQFVRALSARIENIESLSEAPLMDVEASYLALNQVTPFVRFAHLTANQAILETVQDQNFIHVVDLNIMQGVQWPPFMQALAERPGGTRPALKITGAGPELHSLNKTGRRLHRFAQTLGLSFEFHALPEAQLTANNNIVHSPGEALAVNCMFQLHRLLDGNNYNRVRSLLMQIKGMEPKVVTVAEKETDNNQSDFMARFSQTLAHYSSIFDSLEATLPPNSRERHSVEEIWLGREILNIISFDERHQRFERWAQLMTECGFASIPLSEFAVSQAGLLLRLHYPSEGYQLQAVNNCFFLGWQNNPLFSVSSWR